MLSLNIVQQPIMFTQELIDENTIVDTALNYNQVNFENLLKYLSDHYHNNTSLISDKTYDELVDIYEAKFGSYDIVGADPTGSKVPLPHYLGSLRKLTKEKDLTKWLSEYPGPYLVQDKIDGLTILFHTTVSNNRRTTKVYTRGGGFKGQDVSHMLPYLAVPDWLKNNTLEIPYLGAINLSIRGELVMNRDIFNLVGEGFSNARNYASGIVNRIKNIDTNIISSLSYYAYRIIGSGLVPTQEIHTLQAIGFQVPTPVAAPMLSQEILENYYKSRRETAPYDIDGLVIYQDIIADYPVGDKPRHVVAFKTEGETAVTTVKEVVWEASKNRKLAPVVIYEPINLSGVVLTRASGYNGRYIYNNNIGPGAQILVTRSGDVIPKIVAVITPSPTGPDLPKKPFGWNENQVEFITLDENDEEVLVNKLKYFLETLEIMGFGPERIKLLVKAGVRDISSLINITPEQIATIPGIGPTLSTQLYNDLQGKIKNVALPLIMVASGIFPGIGLKRMETIIERYPNLLEYADIDPDTVASYIKVIRGFNTMADDVASKLKTFRNWLRANPSITVDNVVPPPPITGGKLQGVKVVFSGARNKELEKVIKEQGGSVMNSVSKNTNYLLMADVNDIKGKGEKAIKLGVPIMSHADFIAQYLN